MPTNIPETPVATGRKAFGLSRTRLNVSGWLAIISALVTVPMLIAFVSMMLGGGNPTDHPLIAVLSMIAVALFLYLIVTFKHFLHAFFNFYEADQFITALVGTKIISIVLTTSSVFDDVKVGASAALLVAIGVIFVAFAIKLFRLPHLFGLRKPFVYTTIVVGVSYVSIFFFPIAIIGSIISDILLAIIFFRGMDALPDPRQGESSAWHSKV